MPQFNYTAKDSSSKLVVSVIEAENIKAAAGKLQTLGLYPVSIAPSSGSVESQDILPKNKKIKRSDVVLFTRRLADSLKGGLTLVRALGVLERQTENKGLTRVTKELRLAVQEGQNFSQALKKYPVIFPEIYVGMVQAGESAGLLDSVLLRLAEFNEKEEELRNKIQASLAYPAVMMSVGFASVIFLLTFVIPKFEMMFEDLGQMIPLPTRILLFLSYIIRHLWWLYIPLGALAVFLGRRYYFTEKGRETISEIKIKLPIFGDFIKKDIVSRFIRMFSVLLGNGVPILDALNMAKISIGNKVFENEIDKICQSVKEGKGLIEPISKSPYFPPMVAEMIAIGEETGNIEGSLLKTAETYDREVDQAIKTMTSLLDPLIILLCGVAVCFIALSMLLPVFQISAGIK